MKLRLVLVVFSSVLFLTGCGGGGDGGDSASSGAGRPADAMEADRTVEVEALDTLRFDPSDIEAEVGETITFSVTNGGDLEHEFVIGDEDEAMQEHGDSMGHGAGSLLLEGGESGEVTWTFTDAGELQFACYIDGHNSSGMEGTISIAE